MGPCLLLACGDVMTANDSGAPKLSVVVPVHNEAESIPKLMDELKSVAADKLKYEGPTDWEVVFVDDGSTDDTAAVLQKLFDENPNVGVIRFRGNQGKSAALAAGFREAAGDAVVTMDGDLQDDPAEIPSLLAKLDEGYDLVSGWKRKRHDPPGKVIPSRIFNWMVRVLAGLKLHDINCGLKAYRQQVLREVVPYGQMHRFLPVLAQWRGFRVAEVVVNHRPRLYGRTKFGASRFLAGFFDLLTVVLLGRYRRTPMHLFGLTGAVLLVLGMAINVYLTIGWFQGIWIGRRPLLQLGVLLTILGIQFLSMGLLGEMISQSLAPKEHDYPIAQRLTKRRAQARSSKLETRNPPD
jgi:glycosyltransferase involved in cell wall biosynthesis